MHAEALYILGDLFEAWIGDDDDSAFNRGIIATLAQLTQHGVPIYLMRGNRDFLLGERFAQHIAATLLPDPTVITLYGQPILLMHGDSLCTDDTAHQKFRKLTQNRLCQQLALTLPLSLRRYLAQKLRNKSQRRQRQLTEAMLDATEEAVITTMHQHDVTLMIHGHTHQPNIHRVIVNEHAAKRIVLGSWHEAASVLWVDEDQHHELLSIPFN